MSQYFIASLKHTSKAHEHITFWGRFYRGYRLVIDDNTGRYCFGEAMSMNDGLDFIAVPVKAVETLLSPTPFFSCQGVGAQFYDMAGPVVDNTRTNWNRLIEASITEGRQVKKIKPEPFRGKRRSFAIAANKGELSANQSAAIANGEGRQS